MAAFPAFLISTWLGVGDRDRLVLGAVFVVVCAWLLRRVWQGKMDWIDGAGWAMLAMLVAASSLLPWYVAWLLPLVGARRGPPAVALWRSILTGVVLVIRCSATSRTAAALVVR